MSGIVSHTSRRTGWHSTCHTYIVDIGDAIEIQQIVVMDPQSKHLLNEPVLPTRYFEVEIDEIRNGSTKTGAFRNIWPVRAHRRPDWHILRFRIRRGRWMVTERIHSSTPTGDVQWLYTDDFNLLFVASGGRHDAEALMNLIAGKLDAIAKSIRAGSRIPSEFENQQLCRAVMGNLFSEGVGAAFDKTVLYRNHVGGLFGEMPGKDGVPSGAGISACHGKARIPSGQVAENARVDLDQIEDLRDLSWLYE